MHGHLHGACRVASRDGRDVAAATALRFQLLSRTRRKSASKSYDYQNVAHPVTLRMTKHQSSPIFHHHQPGRPSSSVGAPQLTKRVQLQARFASSNSSTKRPAPNRPPSKTSVGPKNSQLPRTPINGSTRARSMPQNQPQPQPVSSAADLTEENAIPILSLKDTKLRKPQPLYETCNPPSFNDIYYTLDFRPPSYRDSDPYLARLGREIDSHKEEQRKYLFSGAGIAPNSTTDSNSVAGTTYKSRATLRSRLRAARKSFIEKHERSPWFRILMYRSTEGYKPRFWRLCVVVIVITSLVNMPFIAYSDMQYQQKRQAIASARIKNGNVPQSPLDDEVADTGAGTGSDTDAEDEPGLGFKTIHDFSEHPKPDNIAVGPLVQSLTELVNGGQEPLEASVAGSVTADSSAGDPEAQQEHQSPSNETVEKAKEAQEQNSSRNASGQLQWLRWLRFW